MEPITLRLSEYAINILFNRLHIKAFEEVIDIEYKSDGKVDKNKARFFNKRVRGSVRIKDGRYLTEEEKEERFKKFQEIQFP